MGGKRVKCRENEGDETEKERRKNEENRVEMEGIETGGGERIQILGICVRQRNRGQEEHVKKRRRKVAAAMII